MREKDLKEGLADLAYKAESDHEVQMARAELYKIAKYAIKMHEMLKGVEEREGLEGWVQSKITKAADYMGSVYHHMDYEQKFDEVQEAKKAGIDISKPFAFLLSGNITKLNWHIIDWDESQEDHSPQNHLNSGLNGVLAYGDVEILGFFSKQHEGVFTHKGSNTHMHFRTDDVSLAGHVDGIFLGENMTLKLPKN